jgi:hypothetical protein
MHGQFSGLGIMPETWWQVVAVARPDTVVWTKVMKRTTSGGGIDCGSQVGRDASQDSCEAIAVSVRAGSTFILATADQAAGMKLLGTGAQAL